MLETDSYLRTLELAKQWGLHAHLKGLDVEQRLTFARNAVSAAAAARDEEAAIQQLELLRLACDDVQAVALRRVSNSDAAFRDRMYRLQEQACARFAAEAVTLWRETPSEREVPGRPGEDRTRLVPTLVEYKRKLMELIIQRWQITDDEAEADGFLDVIIAAMKRDEGSYGFLSLAIRETRGARRHRDRILRGVQRIVTKTKDSESKEDPAKSLLTGLVCDFNHEEIAALGGILQHLPLGNLHQCWAGKFKAQPLLDAVAREAEVYRKMHDVVCELRAALKYPNCKVHDVDVAYPHVGQVQMTIGIVPDVMDALLLEKAFKGAAQNLTRQVNRWLKEREVEKRDAPLVSLTVAWLGTKRSQTVEIG